MPKNAKPLTSPQAAQFADILLAWYDAKATVLPWRASDAPYRVWLSEIMLQQTRVITVQSYYERFLKAYPDVHALAAAPLDEVLKHWEGLGYYTRARNLHHAAQAIVSQHAGQFPATAEILQTLPGIGRYTAAAIASIAFAEPIAVVDGNVMRILARIYDFAETLGQSAADKQLWHWAEGLLSKARPGDYNQAMMDLGRMICLPRNPLCTACPVNKYCLSFKNKTQNLRPVKKAKAPLPTVRSAVAVVQNTKDQYLLVRRLPHGLLGGLWTFPGGQCADKESFGECLLRVIPAEFNLQIEVEQEIIGAKQTLNHFHLQLRAFKCQILAGRPKVQDQRKLAWVKIADFNQYSFGKADREVADALTRWQPRLFEEL